MIVLLGASGYVGGSYRRYLQSKEIEFVSVSRRELNYYDPSVLTPFLESKRASFLINCAGYTGKPNVDACELDKTGCLLGNAILPGVLASVCAHVGIPLGHISSGCIYTGKRQDGSGFSETDPPNFSFRTNNCSFYSGTKALGEEILADFENVYIWRIRIPFDRRDNARNYLSKLMRYEKLLDAENSISQLEESVAAAFACWEKKVPFGIYNVTNPGAITTRQVVEWIRESKACTKEFQFFEDEEAFMLEAAKTPRSNCLLNSDKLADVGIHMTPVEEAIKSALRNWAPE